MATNPTAASNTWLSDIVTAMRHLGGQATLSELYDELIQMRLNLPDSWKEVISRVIQNHSSDASDFNPSFTDLFYSVSGLGAGRWGLRGVTPDNPAIPFVVHYALDLESPPLIACEAPDPIKWSAKASEVTCRDCMTHEQFPQSARKVEDITEPPTITANDVLRVAADLIVDANYDYTKAIVAMTSELLGAGHGDTILMTRILRSLAQGD
jgi:hypothetical protein